MEFRKVFKRLRSERDLTQTEMAKILCVSSPVVSMWEAGKRTPDREKLEAIADFFNVDMDYLLGRSEVRQKIHYDADGAAMVYATPEARRLLAYYAQLDSRNRDRLFDYLDLLTRSPES